MDKHTANVLIIDNDEDIQGSLTDMLADRGYSVQVADDGAAGLALLRNGYRPCVILLDLAMPGMEGWDFRAAQLREPALAPIPVVVMSAAGFSANTMRTQFGDVEVISKPGVDEDLVAAISRACTKHK